MHLNREKYTRSVPRPSTVGQEPPVGREHREERGRSGAGAAGRCGWRAPGAAVESIRPGCSRLPHPLQRKEIKNKSVKIYIYIYKIRGVL